MRELKLALRQLERAHRRSLRFADRTERRDPELARRARREADDIARVMAEYRVLIALGGQVAPVSSSEAAAPPRESLASAAPEHDRDE